MFGWISSIASKIGDWKEQRELSQLEAMEMEDSYKEEVNNMTIQSLEGKARLNDAKANLVKGRR